MYYFIHKIIGVVLTEFFFQRLQQPELKRQPSAIIYIIIPFYSNLNDKLVHNMMVKNWVEMEYTGITVGCDLWITICYIPTVNSFSMRSIIQIQFKII